MDEEEDDVYGDIADEELMEAFSQPSQTLPLLPPSPGHKRRRNSHDSNGCGNSGNEQDENDKKKKKKYRIHIAEREAPAPKTVGATQAEALIDSSPYRIRGPIFIKQRPEPPKPPSPVYAAPRLPIAPANFFQPRAKQPSQPAHENSYSHELDDLPSDAFSSQGNEKPSREPVIIGSSPPQPTQSGPPRSQCLVAPQQGLRQTTLFGGRAHDEVPASQVKKVHNFIVDKPPEAPTHHILDREGLKTWVYPTNLGSIRDYQFSIVKHGLFNNLLVALPTGLGKTFIAATIMYNFYRWTKDSKIVFVAPTKPLVAQQVDACFNIVGIPKSQTTMLTGEQAPALRAEEWEEKRVFFMTPQTLQNDLASGIADPKKIALLVVDEAHRATGNYAYTTVVSFIRRFNKSFRILALTATPGASVEAVQEVIDNLEISKVEIRTEESIDIQQYVHQRNIDQIVLDPSDEMIMIKELFAKALQPLVNQLCGQNAYYNKDPMSLTPFGMMQARKKWMGDAGRNASMGLKGMMNALFSILASLAHSIKLLNFHGIGPFFSAINEFRHGVEENKKKPSKYKTQITQNADFKLMCDRIQLWISKDDFVGHPKLTYLCDNILNHFMDAGEGRMGEDCPPSSTRVIVFSEFRDSAEEIVRVLNKHGPMIRATVFVGQQDSKRSEGMNQAKQQETINKFKAGNFNVLVATSIGEEGLDIGQVDLIVCYDASASPIRMLQRMGRTGRKRAGHIVLLLMRGKEEDSFVKAKDNYEQMQKMISAGTRFNFRHDLSVRILPRDITPVVDKRIIEIPVENTQGPALPEPRRRATKGKKKLAKKFHMPDGVETGFRKASRLEVEDEDGNIMDAVATVKKRMVAPKNDLAPNISPESVFLTSKDDKIFVEKYLNLHESDTQEVSVPDMTAHTTAQRKLGPTVHVAHGQHTERCVKLFDTLARSQNVEDRYTKPYGDVEPPRNFWTLPALVEDEDNMRKTVAKQPKQAKAKPAKKTPEPKKPARKSALIVSDIESSASENDPTSSVRRTKRVRDGFAAASSSEGQGDDIHSESVSEDEDSDIGSLQDFIADGTQLNSSFNGTRMAGSSTTPPATEPLNKPFFVPTQFGATQDTDEELPDIEALFGGGSRTRGKVRGGVEEDGEDTPVAKQRQRRKKVVEDTDSDE